MAKIKSKFITFKSSFKAIGGSTTKFREQMNLLFLVLHKDNSVCWPITDYLISQSTTNSQAYGTLEDTAYSLKHFVQFIDDNKISILQTTDHDINLFQSYLADSKKISNNQINKIINRVFDFYFKFDSDTNKKFNCISNSIENRAKINVRIKNPNRRNGNPHFKNRYYHPSHRPSTQGVKRRPPSNKTIELGHNSIYSYTKNPHIIDRWHIILELLEQSGARVSELSLLKTTDFTEAYRQESLSEYSLVNFRTTKTRGELVIRAVPIPTDTIKRVINFIDYTRPYFESKAIKTDSLFISCRGTPMSGGAFSQHISKVWAETNSGNKFSAHLFRHAFITKQVMIRLKEYIKTKGFISPDLSEMVLRRVQKLTGHKSLDSLAHYIDFAIEEMEMKMEGNS